MKGWMYILECSDGSYYTGSTNNLDLRIQQHQNGEGANHTKKRLPVKLAYVEEFERVDSAFYREKQVQGWSRKKKDALINGEHNKLPELSKNYTQNPHISLASTSSATDTQTAIDVASTSSATDTQTAINVASTGSATSTPLSENNTPLPEPVEGKIDHA